MKNIIVNRIDFTGITHTYNTMLNKLYSRKVLFLHVPKSGGTSLSHTMRATFPLSFFKLSEEASREASPDMRGGDWMDFKKRLAAYHAHLGKHYIQGHFPITKEDLDAHFSEYAPITLLRSPIDRIISIYYFDERLRSMSPGEFLDSERGFIESHVLCHFFGGLGFELRGELEEARDNAIETLSRFDVVGILERQAEFAENVRNKLGINIVLPKRNVGVERKKRSKGFSEEEMSKLTEMTKYDQEIYDHWAWL